MAISIKQPPEPNSRYFLRQEPTSTAEDLIYMESDAARQLADELRGYCDGRNNGRSFLIAGHRGAGKTTLVHVAMHLATKSSKPSAETCIPFIVPLQGPTLLGKA